MMRKKRSRGVLRGRGRSGGKRPPTPGKRKRQDKQKRGIRLFPTQVAGDGKRKNRGKGSVGGFTNKKKGRKETGECCKDVYFLTAQGLKTTK